MYGSGRWSLVGFSTTSSETSPVGRLSLVLAIVCCAVVAGAIAATDPTIIVLVCGFTVVSLLALLLRMPVFFSLVLLATPVAMGQSGLSPGKFAWLAILAVSIPSVFVSDSAAPLRKNKLFVAAIRGSVLIFLSLSVGFLVGKGNGGNLGDFARSCSAYLLLALSPFVAAVLSMRFTYLQLERLLCMLGLFSTLSVSLYWLSERGVIALERLPLFPAGSLLLLLLFYSLAKVKREPNVRWAVVLASALLAIVLNGSRSGLVAMALVVTIFLLFGRDLQDKLSLKKNLTQAIVLIVFVVMSVGVLTKATLIDSSVLEERYASIVTGGEIFSGDQSGQSRLLFGKYALHTFRASPVFGFGPGGFERGFPSWANDNSFLPPHLLPDEYRADTPLAILPILGLLGVIAIAIALIANFRLIRIWEPKPPSQLRDTLTLFAFYFALVAPFSAIYDEKTFGVALSLLLAMAMVGKKSGASTYQLVNDSGKRQSCQTP